MWLLGGDSLNVHCHHFSKKFTHVIGIFFYTRCAIHIGKHDSAFNNYYSEYVTIILFV